MKFLALAVSLALVLPNFVAALYSLRDPVLQLNQGNFKSEVLESEHVVIVEFYAPWCGHCKNLAPEYKKAGEKLKGLAKVAAVDCDQHKGLCGQYGIQGFPTIKVFGANKKAPLDYQGQRTAGPIVDYVVGKIPSFVEKIGSGDKQKSYESFIEENADMPKVILASKKAATPPLFKALSVEYHHRLSFGEIRSTESEILANLDVTTFPSVLLFAANEQTPVVYEGPMKHAALSEFFEKYALPPKKKPAKKPQGSSSSKKKPTATPTPEPVAKFDPTIKEIKSQEDLVEVCPPDAGTCIISFFVLEPEYEESVAQHKGHLDTIVAVKKHHHVKNLPASFGWVNVAEHGKKLMSDFDVSDMLPGLLAINRRHNVYQNFRGAFEEAAVVRFLEDMRIGRGRLSKFSFELQLDKQREKTEL
ncbi:uncharacterized protein BJ171DRAFT_570309 [Polychytrium aggregatum]|uniref:uncharacterized protein n=1 Tax=Polychytrium aggregatum TaxID=110093 RepID=UPI0022FE891E|nr:uncharacterized protein BJ171DRAFT_570309 [Polychytrium aggregatum]KAI9199748.1 hypothetical protein BJ171DRAFT_570309 [Polychytrium aggregatum]